MRALEMTRCQWCLEFSLCQDARDASGYWSSLYARMPERLGMPCLEFSFCQDARDASDAWSSAYARMPGMPVMPRVHCMP
jgi:hypothetical protein